MVLLNSNSINKRCIIKSFKYTQNANILASAMKNLVGRIAQIEEIDYNDNFIMVMGWWWHPNDLKLVKEKTCVTINSKVNQSFDKTLLDL